MDAQYFFAVIFLSKTHVYATFIILKFHELLQQLLIFRTHINHYKIKRSLEVHCIWPKSFPRQALYEISYSFYACSIYEHLALYHCSARHPIESFIQNFTRSILYDVCMLRKNTHHLDSLFSVLQIVNYCRKTTQRDVSLVIVFVCNQNTVFRQFAEFFVRLELLWVFKLLFHLSHPLIMGLHVSKKHLFFKLALFFFFYCLVSH